MTLKIDFCEKHVSGSWLWHGWQRDAVDRWRRPAHARRSTHNRAECLGARLGVTDGTDRSRAREQFLHFGCR